MSRRMTPAVPNAAHSAGSPPKKPYAAPVLRKLGSVRELTLGKSNPTPDGKSGGAMGM